MELFEVFSAPYQTKQVGDDVQFTSANGITYTVKFLRHKKAYGKNAIEIIFGHDRTEPRLPGHVFFNTYMSKQGDPFKVMGTVYAVVADYLKNKLDDTKIVCFYAAIDEESKQGVYDRLSQKFLKILGDEWKLTTDIDDEAKEYTFTKQDGRGMVKLLDLMRQQGYPDSIYKENS